MASDCPETVDVLTDERRDRWRFDSAHDSWEWHSRLDGWVLARPQMVRGPFTLATDQELK